VATKKLTISVNDKILILLSNFSLYKNDWELPFTLTQQGIADYLSLARCNVSRAMKRLLEDDLVVERKAHIKGIKRKRYVYFPSTQGLFRIQEINEKMDTVKIPFIDLASETTQMTMSEISRELDNRFSLIELYDFYSREQKIDARDLTKKEEKLVDFTEKAPTIENFFGRKEEKGTIEDWIDKSPIVHVHGIAGIGKTTLVGKIVEEYRPRKSVFWFRIHEWSSVRYILNQLSEFFEEIGMTTLTNTLDTTKSLNLESICNIRDIILESFKDLNTLIVLDDVGKSGEKVSEFINLLALGINSAFTGKNIKFTLMLISRDRLPIFDTLQMKKSGRFKEIRLEGLDEKSSMALLKKKMKKPFEFDKIFKLTKGHPLALELIDQQFDETLVEDGLEDGYELDLIASSKDLSQYIYEEIFSKLKEEEKDILNHMSVYRYPVVKSWVQTKKTKKTLDELMNKSLISQSNNMYALHDLVKSFYYFRLKKNEQEEFHKVAGYKYLQEAKYRFNIDVYNEVLYHFQKARDHNFVSEFIISNGEDFISKGYVEELSNILNSVEEERVQERDWGKILFLKSRSLEITGEFATAQDYLKYTISFCKSNRDLITLAKSQSLLGWIKTNQGEWDIALDYYSKSQETLARRGVVGKDSKNQYIKENLTAELYRNIGYIYWRNGDWELAKKNWDMAIKFSKKIQARSLVGEVRVDMGNLYKDQGMWEEGVNEYLEALEIMKELDDKQKMMRVYLNLGAIHVHMGNYDQAIHYLNQDYELAKKIGAIKAEAWSAFNLAEAYAKKGDFASAEDYCQNALMIAEKLNDPLAVSYSYRVYGIIHREKQEWMKSDNYFKQSVSILENINAKYHLAEDYLEYGLMFRAKGDKEQMNTILGKSLSLFNELGNTTYIERIERILNEG